MYIHVIVAREKCMYMGNILRKKRKKKKKKKKKNG